MQLEESERIERAVATYSIVAWRLLWLMYEARQHPERSVEGILEPAEWQALYVLVHRTKVLPEHPPCLGESVKWLAKLGGFLGRKGDGESGIQTLWRGWIQVGVMASMWEVIELK